MLGLRNYHWVVVTFKIKSHICKMKVLCDLIFILRGFVMRDKEESGRVRQRIEK